MSPFCAFFVEQFADLSLINYDVKVNYGTLSVFQYFDFSCHINFNRLNYGTLSVFQYFDFSYHINFNRYGTVFINSGIGVPLRLNLNASFLRYISPNHKNQT